MDTAQSATICMITTERLVGLLVFDTISHNSSFVLIDFVHRIASRPLV